MKKEELAEVLRKHKAWVYNESDGERANLRGANLIWANLSEANLSGANLSEADLIGADLIGANLSEANLRRANLSEADLIGANLSGANLIGANLIGANLRGANLIGANLRGADLSGADGIHQFGPMPTSGRIIYAVRHDTTFMVNAGCFWGTLDELESKVNASHKCPFYLGIIGILRHQLTVQPTDQ